jgi:hypothetical protein
VYWKFSKSYVTGPSSKRYLNEFLFMRVLTQDKIKCHLNITCNSLLQESHISRFVDSFHVWQVFVKLTLPINTMLVYQSTVETAIDGLSIQGLIVQCCQYTITAGSIMVSSRGPASSGYERLKFRRLNIGWERLHYATLSASCIGRWIFWSKELKSFKRQDCRLIFCKLFWNQRTISSLRAHAKKGRRTRAAAE